MLTSMLFALGTAAVWVALIFALQIAAGLGRKITKEVDVDPRRTNRSLVIKSVVAAIFFAFGVLVTRATGESQFRLPLIWFVMPWTAWLGVAGFVFALMKLIHASTAITDFEKQANFKSAGIAGILMLVMGLLYFQDKTNTINILTGGIPMTIGIFLGFLFLAILTVEAMVLTANSARARGIGKKIVTQLALLAGSIVFGIPFVFLLITSFKEDIDMSSKDGIVWIPRVTETVKYLNEDPTKKRYEVSYEGQKVEAVVIKTDGNRYQMDIMKPMAIRGITFMATRDQIREVPVEAKVFTATVEGKQIKGFERESLEDGRKVIRVMEPINMKGEEFTLLNEQVTPVRHIGLRYQNYPEALDYLPVETKTGLVYLKNTMILVILGVIGTILSSSLVAYGFSRLKFPGKERLFGILLATMMLPGAVTLLPQFLIFRTLGWIDTLYPLWVPAFFGSAFNIFLLRQFFSQIPMELEDAAKIDGCSYLKTFWEIMIPQIKPALAVIAIWTFLGAWNNFIGPLIYINSPENMPLSYALQLFRGDRQNEPGLMMAFTTLTFVPVLALFFFAQRYFIEGVTLSGFGGR